MNFPLLHRLAALAAVAVGIAVLSAGCGDDGSGAGDDPVRRAAKERAEELARQLEREARTATTEGRGPGVSPTVIPDTTTPPVDMLHGDGALVAVRAFRDRLGEVVRVTEVFLYADGRMIVEAQDPARPENLDRYVYRNGRVEDPEPVRLSAHEAGQLSQALFSLGDVRWEVIPTLSTATLERLAIDDAQITHMGVYRPLPFSTDVRIRAFAHGSRRDGYLDATADGTVLEASLS